MRIQKIGSNVMNTTRQLCGEILHRCNIHSEPVDVFQFSSKINEDAYKNSYTYNQLIKFFKSSPIEKELPFLNKVKSAVAPLFCGNKKQMTTVKTPPNVEELMALSFYQRGSNSNVPILMKQAKNSPETPYREWLTKNLQNLLKKNSTNRDTVLYRGIKRGEIVNEADISFSATENGMDYKDFIKLKSYKSNSFVATSTMPDVAYEFGEQNALVARIYAPKGTKGVYMPEYMQKIIDTASDYNASEPLPKFCKFPDLKILEAQKKSASEEHEFLLPIDTKFRILKHHDVEGVKVVDAIVEGL